MSKLESLLDDYSMYSKDPLLESSILETKAYLKLEKSDYSSAINLLNQSLKINDIEFMKVRLEIAKARTYIANSEYGKAASLLHKLKEYGVENTNQKNIIDELTSYVSHIE